MTTINEIAPDLFRLAKNCISMLLVYPKSEQDDLSADQVKQLRKALEI